VKTYQRGRFVVVEAAVSAEDEPSVDPVSGGGRLFHEVSAALDAAGAFVEVAVVGADEVPGARHLQLQHLGA